MKAQPPVSPSLPLAAASIQIMAAIAALTFLNTP